MKRTTKDFYGLLVICLLSLAIFAGCPGPASDTTASTDTTAPINTTASDFISSGASSTSSTTVTLAISATDSVGVTGYYASETSTAPSASSGWISVTSTTSYSANVSFTLSSGDATKTVYVWFKDAAGNVSASASDSITLTATLASKLVGTWGVASLHHTNAGEWQTESTKVTFNSDGTCSGGGTWNSNGSVGTDSYTCTYTQTSNTDSSISMTMNWISSSGTGSWSVKMVLSDDGKMIITDGTADTSRQFMQVMVRLDTAKTYTNADLIGDYFMERYRYNGTYAAITNISTFDGLGNRSYTNTTNADGVISTDAGPIVGTYNVSSDGLYMVGNDNTGAGYLLGDGKFGVNTHINDPATWSFGLSMKKGDKTYSTADLAGTWAYSTFGDNDGTSFSVQFATMTCDSSGNCSTSEKIQRDGSITYQTSSGTSSVAPDGSITDANNLSKIMAIGNNGNTLIVNNSFDTNNSGKRRIGVFVKCSACGDLAAVPSNNDFAGIWNGNIAWVIPPDGNVPAEDTNCTLTVNLAVNSNQLAGTMTGSNCTGPAPQWTFNISGTVSNGTFSFNIPSSDTTNPDCANWNMPATATLDSNLTTMTLNSSGTVCGPGGGKPGSFSGTATKQ